MKDMVAEQMQSGDWLVEETACPLCGSGATQETPNEQPPFQKKKCASCSLAFLSPRLAATEAERFYSSDHYLSFGDGVSGYDDYSVQEPSLRATFRKLLKTIEKQNVTGGALLEVECGPGYPLDETLGYFDTRAGVELSPATARDETELTGAKIYLSVDEIDESPLLDCIVATHVIEHISEPVGFVKSLARRLKPDGSIILAAPDMGSVFRHVVGRHWRSFKHPEHMTFFDQKTLPDLFQRADLEVVERAPYPHVFPLSLVMSIFGLCRSCWKDRMNLTLRATIFDFRAKRRSI